jgi:TPP-dependent indolepyruvate ferredoxin oxidoreductase alpha subunit
VAFKALADTVETSASVNVDPFAVETIIPADFELPADGLNLRWPDPPLVQEKRLLHHKLYAALAYCRANQLNKVSSTARTRAWASSPAARAISMCARPSKTSASTTP